MIMKQTQAFVLFSKSLQKLNALQSAFSSYIGES